MKLRRPDKITGANPGGSLRATCFGLGLILAAGGSYLFLCGAGLIAGETHLPGILDLLLGLVVIQCGSSMFRARRLLAAPIAAGVRTFL